MNLHGLRVFLAEDEPLLLMELEENLGDLGCKVVGTASKVSETLEILASEEFDLAILDVRLRDSTIEPVGTLLLQEAFLLSLPREIRPLSSCAAFQTPLS